MYSAKPPEETISVPPFSTVPRLSRPSTRATPPLPTVDASPSAPDERIRLPPLLTVARFVLAPDSTVMLPPASAVSNCPKPAEETIRLPWTVALCTQPWVAAISVPPFSTVP